MVITRKDEMSVSFKHGLFLVCTHKNIESKVYIDIMRWDIFKGIVQAFKNLYLVWKIEIVNNIRI